MTIMAVRKPPESSTGAGAARWQTSGLYNHKQVQNEALRLLAQQARERPGVRAQVVAMARPLLADRAVCVSAAEALAIRPMTIEEAVKEAEFRDRDLLVFRDLAGDLFVLHRRRDGTMELVEVP